MNINLKVQDIWRTVIKVEDSSPSRGQFIHNRLTGLCGDIRNIYIYKTTFNTHATGEEVEDVDAVVHSFVEFYKPASLDNARCLYLHGVRMYSMTGALTKEYASVVANALPDSVEYPAACKGRDKDTVVHVADSTASKGMVIHRILTQLCGEICNSYVYTPSDPSSEAEHHAHAQVVHSFVEFKEPASAARARALVNLALGTVVISRMSPALTKEYRDILYKTLPHIVSAPLSYSSSSWAPSSKSTAAGDPPMLSSSPAPTAIRFASHPPTPMVKNTTLLQPSTSETTPTAAQIPSVATTPFPASSSTTAALTCTHTIEKPPRVLPWTSVAMDATYSSQLPAPSSLSAAVRSEAHLTRISAPAAVPASRVSPLIPAFSVTDSTQPSVVSQASGSIPPTESATPSATTSDSETTLHKDQNAISKGGHKENISDDSPAVPSKRKEAELEEYAPEHELSPTPMPPSSYFGEAAAKRMGLREELDWEALRNKAEAQITVCKDGDKENLDVNSQVMGSEQKSVLVEERTPWPGLLSIHTTPLMPLLQQQAPAQKAKRKVIEGRDPVPQLPAWVRPATPLLHQPELGGDAESIEGPVLPPTPLSLAHTTIPLPLLASDAPSVLDSAHTAGEEGEIEEFAEGQATTNNEQVKPSKSAKKKSSKRRARERADKLNPPYLSVLTTQPAAPATITGEPSFTPGDPKLPPASTASSQQTAAVSFFSPSAGNPISVFPVTPLRFVPGQAVLPHQQLGLEVNARGIEEHDLDAKPSSWARLAISPLQQLGMEGSVEPIEGPALPPTPLHLANSVTPLPLITSDPPLVLNSAYTAGEKGKVEEPAEEQAIASNEQAKSWKSAKKSAAKQRSMEDRAQEKAARRYPPYLESKFIDEGRAAFIFPSSPSRPESPISVFPVTPSRFALKPAVFLQQELGSNGKARPTEEHDSGSKFPPTVRPAINHLPQLGLKWKARQVEGHNFDPKLMTPLSQFGSEREAEEGPLLPPTPLSLAYATIPLPTLTSEPPSVPDSIGPAGNHQHQLELRLKARLSELEDAPPLTPASRTSTTTLLPPLASDPPSAHEAFSTNSTPSESTVLLHPMQLPAVVPSGLRFTPFTLQTNIVLTVYGERITLDLNTLAPEPRVIVEMLKISASERDKWIIVACYYKNKGMPASAVEVLQAMLDVMMEYGMDERSLKPAFLMLFHCETEIAKTVQRQSEHTEKAVKWLQKVYGELPGVPEQAAGNSLGIHVPKSAIANGYTVTSPTPPPPAPVAIPIGPSHVRRLQEELTQLRSANIGLVDEVSTVRAAKRLLEGDMVAERNVRRRLEHQLVLEGHRGQLARVMVEEERVRREKAECRAKKDSHLLMALRRERLGT